MIDDEVLDNYRAHVTAVSEMAFVFTGRVAYDVARALTCNEYAALRYVLELGGGDLDSWDDEHARGDCEPGDCMYDRWLAEFKPEPEEMAT